MATPNARPYTLTIAGFDPSGGAGVLADCKTFEALDTQGLAVLTANTLQTEDRFVSPGFIGIAAVLEQLDLILRRYPIAAAKVGLVQDGNTLCALLTAIRTCYPSIPIVVDPVLKPTASAPLGSEWQPNTNGPVAQYNPALWMGMATLVTPNLPEYEGLFGQENPANVAHTYQTALLLKGGHSTEASSAVTDRLYPPTPHGEVYQFTQPRSALSKHGTGCVLSAAITAYLALGHGLPESCRLAQAYVARYIESDSGLLGRHPRGREIPS